MDRHPILYARYLAACNAWLRRSGTDMAIAIVIVLLVAVALWMAAPSWHEAAARVEAWIDRYELGLGAVAAIHAAMLVAHRRRHESISQRTSWLAAAPIDGSSTQLSILLATLLAAIAHLAAIVFVLTSVAVVSGKSLLPGSTAAVAAGFVAGGLVGWHWRVRQSVRLEASRYSPKLRSCPERLLPLARALAHWPIAQTLAWQRPENSRIVLLVALMAVQGGSSMVLGLCVVGAWLLATYLATLLCAMMHTGRAAATWLASTPIGFVKFAWSVAKQALLHQCAGTLVAAVMGVVLGAPPATMMYLAIVWITLVVVVSAVSLADNYRCKRSGLKLALSLTGFAAIEARIHGWGIPLAVAMAAWHCRNAILSQRGSS